MKDAIPILMYRVCEVDLLLLLQVGYSSEIASVVWRLEIPRAGVTHLSRRHTARSFGTTVVTRES